jgi:hypothetical protein
LARGELRLEVEELIAYILQNLASLVTNAIKVTAAHWDNVFSQSSKEGSLRYQIETIVRVANRGNQLGVEDLHITSE